VYAAHLASWKTSDGEQQIFVSSTAEYGGGKAIRGGIPICWPQFAGKGPYKKHGFARNSDKWKVVRTATEPFPSVVLGLTDDETTLAEYPSKFSLTYSVALESATSISVSMTVSNPGTDPLSFTTALHTYFKVSDVASTKLLGLGGIKYEDNSLAGGGKETVQESAEVGFPAEVDRIYYGAPSEAYIVDGDRAIKVLKMGFADAVVWNIGAERAPGLKDLAPGEWKQYVCYEAAAIVSPIKLSPNTSWTAGQSFTRISPSDVPEQCGSKAS